MAGSWSTSTQNEVPAREFSPFKTIEWTFTADADNGSVPDLAVAAADLYFMSGTWINRVEVLPDLATAPTALFDVTIEDTHGDILNGALANLPQTRVLRWPLNTAEIEDNIPMDGRALTVKVSGNSVHSAVATIRLILAR